MWEGWRCEASPYPDQNTLSRIKAHIVHFQTGLSPSVTAAKARSSPRLKPSQELVVILVDAMVVATAFVTAPKISSGACIFIVAFYITEWYELAVRVFKDLEFASWADDEGLADESLCAAAAEIENGLVNGNLGGFLVKKRVGAPGRGKRGGYRTIVAHRQGDRLFFPHGLPKMRRTISPKRRKKPFIS